MIVFTNVSKKYNNSVALDDVSFKINPGEFVSLVGESGAGKSTIIKLLIGEEKPSAGRVLVGSYEVNKLKFREMPALRRQIGTVFQDFKLLSTKNAYENIAFALEVEGKSELEIQDEVLEMLDMVGLADKKNNFPHELSGGEKQRVAISRAMIHKPAVIVADEPTGNLDDRNSEEILKLLLKINNLGTTIILATHNQGVVNNLNKRVITLSNGRIIRDEAHGKYSLK